MTLVEFKASLLRHKGLCSETKSCLREHRNKRMKHAVHVVDIQISVFIFVIDSQAYSLISI